MSRESSDKAIYDQLAVDYFLKNGWRPAFAVKKRGGYTDVLAMKGKDLAIVEVKSPQEMSAVKKWDDSKQLSEHLEEEIGDYLQNTRLKVFGLFPERGQPIEKLYAATVACQLFRYFHEFEDRAVGYEKVSGGVKLQGIRFNKIPYIVVPTENAAELRTALDAIKKNGYITSSLTKDGGAIVVARIAYP